MRVPTHEIASASYINDDGVHYVTLKISAAFGFDAAATTPPSSSSAPATTQQQQQQQQQQAILARRNEEICDLVVLHVSRICVEA